MDFRLEMSYTDSASYGRFGISEGFKKYLTATSVKFQDYDIDCARHDPALINAIADFGHTVCKKVPHILADFRTSKEVETTGAFTQNSACFGRGECV